MNLPSITLPPSNHQPLPPPTRSIGLTQEQQMCIDWVHLSTGNLLIEAVAGSGKTFTIIEMIVEINLRFPQAKIALMSFNAKVRDELKLRVKHRRIQNCDVNTVHGFGFAAFKEKYGSRKPNSYKLQDIFEPMLKKAGLDWKLNKTLCTLVGLAKDTGVGVFGDFSFNDWKALIDKHDLSWDEEKCSLEALIVLAAQGFNASNVDREKIDFSDMIYFPLLDNLPFPEYDFVFIDEAQDTNATRREVAKRMLRKRDQESAASSPGGRLITVGDRHQCQPAGTYISVPGGHKLIEDIKIGDEVISLHTDKQHLRPRKVLQTASRIYAADLITVSTSLTSYDCTPNHRCLVRLSEISKSYTCVYLMRRGNNFRIGKTVLYRNEEKESGIALRARQEKADAIWLLKVFHTKEEALSYEMTISAEYGLPLFCFVNSGKLAIGQERLDAMWNTIGNNLDKAALILYAHKRELNYPLWSREERTQLSYSRNCLVRACNLENELFDVIHSDLTWEQAKISKRLYYGTVYSLEVENNRSTNYMGLYLANNIVTGNSVYGFTGADNDALDILKAQHKMSELKLSVCFRCSTSVISHARKLVSHIHAKDNALTGSVRSQTEAMFESSLFANDPENQLNAILCRKNAPLTSLAFRLLRANIPCRIEGHDIGQQLTHLCKKFKPTDKTNLTQSLRKHLTEQSCKLSPYKFSILEDKISCITSVLAMPEILSVEDFYKKIELLFSDYDPNLPPRLTLSSIHKSKGLEWPTVYLLGRNLWQPSPFASQPWMLDQETNLTYVAITRAKVNLIEVLVTEE